MTILYVVLGAAFGFVLSRSGAADYDFIQAMFLFESFQLYGIVAHVLTYSAHRRELARAMLARLGVGTGRGDPLDWMRGH